MVEKRNLPTGEVAKRDWNNAFKIMVTAKDF